MLPPAKWRFFDRFSHDELHFAGAISALDDIPRSFLLNLIGINLSKLDARAAMIAIHGENFGGFIAAHFALRLEKMIASLTGDQYPTTSPSLRISLAPQ
jgi:hypothetical protein